MVPRDHWLLFYDLTRTEYQNTEVILESHIFHLIEKDNEMMKKKN